MFQISQLYNGIDNFHSFLIDNDFDLSSNCLVRLFTDCLGKESISSAISSIRQLLPNAHVVGATSSGAVIFKAEQYEQNSVIIVNTFDKIRVRPLVFDWENLSPLEVLKNLKVKYAKHSFKTQVNIIFSNTCGQLYDILDDFVHYSNNTHPFINFVGGVAGNIDDNSLSKSYVFYNDQILENGVLAFSFEARNTVDPIDFFTYTSIAADEISVFHEVTAVNGNQILEIDDTPAIDWFYDFLDIKNDEKISFDEFKKIAGEVHFSGFSIISNKHNDTSRCVLYDDTNFIISLFSSKMSVGSKFKVGYLNPKRVMNESFILSGKILQENIQSVFVYSCSARKSFLKYAAQLELMPLSKNDVSGIFMLGEICNQDGKNNLYNASCCLLGFSEVPNSHLHVDTSMLIQENIAGDMKFYNKALIKHNDIIADFEDTSSSKYLDPDYNMANLLKYNYDASKNIFDKICVAEVITADTTISYIGKDKFVETGRELFAYMGKMLDDLEVSEHINFYILNYKTLIITCSGMLLELEFIDVMRKFHQKFGFVTSKFTEVSAVIRFVVVLNQDDMIKNAVSTLYSYRSSQENFIISGTDSVAEKEVLNKEAFYIKLLKKAIDQDLVTPYFQGMHNNFTNKIDKYEALMRIVDGDDVYLPDSFLGVSKKFKLYTQISKQMLSKALDIFEGSSDTLSINVSLYDVESVSFREWLIGRLKSSKNPQKIVVEFVESEECNDLNLLKEFIKEVRSCGSLIAIDDFGSGYSTFATVANLYPDLLKIDGTIINGIVKNPINLIIMQTICYLAESLNINTIAEFVDSQAIQDLVVESGVNHSQGYLFSLPSPNVTLNYDPE